jgi:hypothetical protein
MWAKRRRKKRGNFVLCLTTKFANFAFHQSTYNLVEYHLTKSTIWYICVDSMKTYEDITNILENIKNLHDNVGSEREFWKLTKGFDGTWWIQIQSDPITLLFKTSVKLLPRILQSKWSNISHELDSRNICLHLANRFSLWCDLFISYRLSSMGVGSIYTTLSLGPS